MAKERIKRKTMSKTLDITKPLTLTDLATKDDPCFGKLHDPRNATCMRCGDNEFCVLAMGQLTHMKRLKIEKEQQFKDLEEKGIKKMDKVEMKKAARKRIKEMIKQKGGASMDEIVHDLFTTYGYHGLTKTLIPKMVAKLQEKYSNITFKKNKYSWK